MIYKSEPELFSGRYRLGVRIRGSQPRDRGSIPRTATNALAGLPLFCPDEDVLFARTFVVDDEAGTMTF